MHGYPGINPISFGGSGAPGVVVSPQPAGSGTYSLPQVVDAGDPRSAGNLMAGIEANRDAIVWCTRRTPDWVSGGDYRTLFRPQVSLANSLVLDRSGVGDGLFAIITQGSSSNGYGGDFYGGGATGWGVRATGGTGVADGGEFISGQLGGTACKAHAYPGSGAIGCWGIGDGASPGGTFSTGAGGTALDDGLGCYGGLFALIATAPAVTDAVPANRFSNKHIAKAWCEFVSSGALGTQLVSPGGINIASVTLSAGVIWHVQFVTAMADAHYDVTVNAISSATDPHPALGLVRSTAGFTFQLWDTVGAGVQTTPLITGEPITINVHANQ